MHPALYSWRDDLPAHIVRLLSYVGALAILSIVMAQFFQSPPVKADITPIDRSDWIDIERPFPAFALAIPEAGDQPARYAIAPARPRRGPQGYSQPGRARCADALSAGRDLPFRQRTGDACRPGRDDCRQRVRVGPGQHDA